MASAYRAALKAMLPSSFTFSAKAALSSSGSGEGLGDGRFCAGFGLGVGAGGVLDPAPGLAVSLVMLASPFSTLAVCFFLALYFLFAMMPDKAAKREGKGE